MTLIKTLLKCLFYLRTIAEQNDLIFKQNQSIIMNQQEEVQILQDLKTTLVKIATETTSLNQKIADLQTAVTNASGVSPEVEQALNDVVAQAKVVDDLVPDAPPTQG